MSSRINPLQLCHTIPVTVLFYRSENLTSMVGFFPRWSPFFFPFLNPVIIIRRSGQENTNMDSGKEMQVRISISGFIQK